MADYTNYDSVIEQLRGYGLRVDALRVTNNVVRVPDRDDQAGKRSGWYSLHELRLGSGDLALIGAYGSWREGVSHKIELRGAGLSGEERAAVRARIKADRQAAEKRRRAVAAKAADRAARVWARCSPQGESAYLVRKGVQGHGVRYTAQGNLLVPMLDTAARIVGLQVIYSEPKVRGDSTLDKEFWPAGVSMRGSYFMMGTPGRVLLICEGYATGATLHEATGHAVAVAWNAGNLLPAGQALARRYSHTKLVFCGDDDYVQKCVACGKKTLVSEPICTHCGQKHAKHNPGAKAAANAAMATGGVWLLPTFAERPAGTKWTDYNDLHQAEGLHVVRAQLERHLDGVGFSDPSAGCTNSGGGGDALQPLQSEQALLERFALIYGHGGAAFDFGEHRIVALSDMRDACTHRELYRRWQENPERQIVRIDDVGFDPGGQEGLRCNLWSGWPTKPRAGSCRHLLDLLEFLCGGEGVDALPMYEWVMKWLAYPIQHPGAKMKTALVLHGPQGAGKNMFFEAVMAIYGPFGRVVDQAAIEDKYNDWASRALFLIADEVVARQELFHVKNKLKSLITGDQIRINPKHVTAYHERNHCNLVFLSNEPQPLVLEPGDRRYAVIWTPPEMPAHYYEEIKAEIADGGIEALHQFFLDMDLGDFAPHTRPPVTVSKSELIDLGLDSTERFWIEWTRGQIDGIRPMPCHSKDLYALYRQWCGTVGISRAAPLHVMLGRLAKRGDCKKNVAWYVGAHGQKLQATFILPESGVSDPPPGRAQSEWLGECAAAFRNALDDWRESISPGKV